MKKVLLRIVPVICALFVMSPVPAFASVGFTEDGAADQTSVYVAGNPDSFPVESYDVDSGAYIGAASAFLRKVSEQTGLSFVYIRAGEQDRRETLARNNQVDLFFATGDEKKLLEIGDETVKLFRVSVKGKPTDVCCVFTSVAGEKERRAIRQVAESLSKDDVSLLLTADSSDFVSTNRFYFTVIVLGGALLAAIVALIVFIVLFLKRRGQKDALIDNVTDIGNKNFFIRMYTSVISDRSRELYYVVRFQFDINRINDNYGNEESDKILRYAADTINQRMKDNEFCARIDGGAFAAAIFSTDVDQVEQRVGEILRVLNAYGGKYKNGEIKTLFHAGVCALAIDDKNPDKVLYNADQAYNRAVVDKKPFVFVSHDVLEEFRTKVSIREQVGEALEKHAFMPFVQFIVDAKNGEIRGGELLSRWQNPLYGMLKPGSYVPILQEMGLIVRHDLMMLEESCKLLAEWYSQGKDYFLTSNLTRTTISDKALVDKVMEITGRYSFPKERLVIEVTEDSLEEDKESALKNILGLKEKGFRIALDDFASGYTAVTNLYEYAVDLVKIDRQMILDAERDPQAAALMKEITRMCHELQIRVLAEGVENEQQARMARSSFCDYIQGYFYARALPLRELSGFEEKYLAKAISQPEEPVEISNAEPADSHAEGSPRTVTNSAE